MELRPRLLFVDDESSLRVLIPALLKLHGFDVIAAATVSEALNLIATQKFDVLLSDLNIGEAGDGFTVVSAMRRTEPNTATFILTGYPAFETALEAIRQQVDDYFVKPADFKTLSAKIMDTLKAPPSQRNGIEVKRLPRILEERKSEILARWIEKATADQQVRPVGLSDQNVADELPILIDEIITTSSDPSLSHNALLAARRHGKTRLQQGSTVVGIIREMHILHGVLSQIVQENLLAADISFLVTDIMRIGEAVQAFLEESLQTYLELQGASAIDQVPQRR